MISRKPLAKRKPPVPQVRHIVKNETTVVYAGRKTPYELWAKRRNAVSKILGFKEADRQWDRDYFGLAVPHHFGSYGQLVLRPWFVEGKRFAYVEGIRVKDWYEHRGLATRMYKKAEEIARKQGLPEIRVWLVNNIERQEKILTELGWKEFAKLSDKNGKMWSKMLI
ncbi:MAG: GNAT family N-acetyltransferase [Candidatus ainarchaeum sp.]|nr:GNAT family N-acetyltransferase [Candidatus ainarchaeum sp.]